MLKSTYKRVAEVPRRQETQPLAPGWTEHKAPTGHAYYYNVETKQSSYNRPIAPTPQAVQPTVRHAWLAAATSSHGSAKSPRSMQSDSNYSRRHVDNRSRRDDAAKDRPKTRHAIMSCSPWLLVKTKLGRRFVHNPQTGESYWKFPKDIMQGVIELDLQRLREKDERGTQRSALHNTGQEKLDYAEHDRRREQSLTAARNSLGTNVDPSEPLASDEEYEEVEITDDEDEDESTKWQKPSPQQLDPERPTELDEDDMTWQLAQMEAEASVDEHGNGEDVEMNDNGGTSWTAADARASFCSLLDDLVIDPYTTWETVLEQGNIMDDDRYLDLSTTRERRDAFASWSAARIADLNEQRQKIARQDPRIAYLALLEKHASPKLYWPEFRRKYKREPELKGTSMNDREREKLYREHVQRTTKLSQRERQTDLQRLLNGVPASDSWNSSTDLRVDELPSALTTDLRWISLVAALREEIVAEHLKTLSVSGAADYADKTKGQKKHDNQREKQDAALRERQQAADEAHRRQASELARSRRDLLEVTAAQRQAVTDVSRDGLRAGLASQAAEEGV